MKSPHERLDDQLDGDSNADPNVDELVTLARHIQATSQPDPIFAQRLETDACSPAASEAEILVEHAAPVDEVCLGNIVVLVSYDEHHTSSSVFEAERSC